MLAVAVAAPSPTVIVGGVTLGEAVSTVRAQLGKPLSYQKWPARKGCNPAGESLTYEVDHGAVKLVLGADGGEVRQIEADLHPERHSRIADSFGVRFGDDVRHIERVRGAPYCPYPPCVYGTSGFVRYIVGQVPTNFASIDYNLHNGVVVSIQASR